MVDTDPLRRLDDAFRTGRPREWFPAKPKSTWTIEYACWRLANACYQSGDGVFGPDHAVLLRQVSRWCPGAELPHLPPALAQIAREHAGVHVGVGGALITQPFAPAWLADDLVTPGSALDLPPSLRRDDRRFKAEPYLAALHYEQWNSPAQKEAAWLALTAPPLSTTLIVLPTGAGKSLCFQAVARQSPGLTVVVVPTVALAMDQCRSATESMKSMNPMYFAAGDRDFPPDAVAAALARGECRMVFTSPEACVSGRLRHVLGELAKTGQLDNLVLDEAHIIETWGAYFRVDFQLLAALRGNWMKESNSGLRTFLLSATISPAARDVLRKLYGSAHQPWREFSSQRLRPEMVYHFRQFAYDDDRNRAVDECLWRLPRPAIFYTTEKAEATDFFERITALGFKRIECFTGDTSARERRRILKAWRDDDSVDLVVATSAFGLGVDKPDVRAVVHACAPENLNRYYQEVGRGGRDGASSICLLLPTTHDFDVAEGMTAKLMTTELVQQRWRAMWEDRRDATDDIHSDDAEHLWRLNPRTQRLGLKGARSWRQNEAWNKRLLLQLERAGKLKIVDVKIEVDAEGETTEWITVRIGFPPGSPNVGQSIAAERNAEVGEAKAGLDQMRRFMGGDLCVSRVLKGIYGRETERVCGGCRDCRRNHRPVPICPPLPIDIDHGQSSPPLLEIVPNCPDPRRASDDFRALIASTLRKGVARFAVPASHWETVLALASQAIDHSPDRWFRVDAIDAAVAFDIRPEEDLVAIHIGAPDAAALKIRRGSRIAHWFCGGFYADAAGRYWLQSEGALRFEGPAHWLAEDKHVHR